MQYGVEKTTLFWGTVEREFLFFKSLCIKSVLFYYDLHTSDIYPCDSPSPFCSRLKIHIMIQEKDPVQSKIYMQIKNKHRKTKCIEERKKEDSGKREWYLKVIQEKLQQVHAETQRWERELAKRTQASACSNQTRPSFP